MLAMPQSLPAADRKASAFCSRLSVKSAGREPVVRGVLLGDRRLERIDRDQVEDRCEGLGLHDRPLVARAHDGRLDEVAGPLEYRPAGEELTAGLLGKINRLGVARHRAGIDQRSHQRAALERVPDPHLLVGVHQTPLQFLGDGLVREHAPRAGAALAGRADRAEEDRRDQRDRGSPSHRRSPRCCRRVPADSCPGVPPRARRPCARPRLSR